MGLQGITRGYKDGLQPEFLADGNWLVKQKQPVSKIETKSDTTTTDNALLLRLYKMSRWTGKLVRLHLSVWAACLQAMPRERTHTHTHAYTHNAHSHTYTCVHVHSHLNTRTHTHMCM
jgi:hypothetical protein